MDNLFECIKCNYTTNKKSSMLNHLNRKNNCSKKIESFMYTDNEVYELSLIRKKEREQLYLQCDLCYKKYCNKYFLEKHKDICKCKNLENQNLNNNNNTFIENQNIENQNIQNQNIQCQNVQNTNKTFIENQNIYIILPNNTEAPIPFEKDWNLEHLNNYIKYALFMTKNKYSELLKKILENEKNLNVILDENHSVGYVYSEDNKYKNMEKKEIAFKSMEKLYNQLIKMKSELELDSFFQVHPMKREFFVAERKYEDYLENKQTQISVDECLNNIYSSKKKESYDLYNKIKDQLDLDTIDGF
jgi:hypothetical protein